MLLDLYKSIDSIFETTDNGKRSTHQIVSDMQVSKRKRQLVVNLCNNIGRDSNNQVAYRIGDGLSPYLCKHLIDRFDSMVNFYRNHRDFHYMLIREAEEAKALRVEIDNLKERMS